MTVRIAINGFGRIGRNILRAVYEYNRTNDVKVVAINDLGNIESSAYLAKYDSTHGRFPGDLQIDGSDLVVNGDKIIGMSERDPAKLDWGGKDIDIVMACSGRFNSREKAQLHLDNGAKKVLISAPAGSDVDATVVYGVNDNVLKAEHRIVSNASCTTNCLAPMIKPLCDTVGVENGLMTTIHAVTNDQRVLDASHKDFRRARSMMASMIPTKTGAAAAVGMVLPELEGKLDGQAVRVPLINVSLVDLTFLAKRDTSADEVNEILKDASSNSMHGVLGYNDEPLVSIDFNHSVESSVFDATQTRVKGRLVKVMAWYDNEWGFCNRMIDTAVAMWNAK
ncbi:MAG: type I glyceraldehyde-3-phosphate dehydrogenase [Legionellales bacterium]|nr:type I glyceraldehyde-3-phosphate dehydrogenase [Legionellales bacterium]|tara:strand:- start:5747 stop:6757 length:1011 start_codon:yes stop_codon:yes gene_type:complete